MAEQEKPHPHFFGYAHSNAVMEALIAYADSKRWIIAQGYDFLEKPGERKMFDKMIEVARECGRDVLLVDTVKEFAGQSLSEFKAALTAIQDAGMLVQSLGENYDYETYMTAIEVLEDLLPEYRKNQQKLMAIGMALMDANVETITKRIGLKQSEVLHAVAEYRKEQEDAAAKIAPAE